MPGEIDHYPVIVLGHRRQPRFKLLLDVGRGGVFVDQLVDVFGGKLSALGADQHGIDRFGIAVRVFQLGFGRQILILRNTDHQRITARDFHRHLTRRTRRLFFEIQVAVLVCRRGRLCRCRRGWGRRRRRLLGKRHPRSQETSNHELRPNQPHRLRQCSNYEPTGIHRPPARSSGSPT